MGNGGSWMGGVWERGGQERVLVIALEVEGHGLACWSRSRGGHGTDLRAGTPLL